MRKGYIYLLVFKLCEAREDYTRNVARYEIGLTLHEVNINRKWRRSQRDQCLAALMIAYHAKASPLRSLYLWRKRLNDAYQAAQRMIKLVPNTDQDVIAFYQRWDRIRLKILNKCADETGIWLIKL